MSSKSTSSKKQVAKTEPGTGSSISPYSHKGGEAAKTLAKKTFKEKRAKGVPKGWPADAAVDDRWCSWLPDGWTVAVKMTEGGILIHCVVGPGPECKLFFHKDQLEKHLGRKLDENERGKKPLDFGDLDPSMFLHRTDGKPATQYILERCDKLHGYSVKEALEDFKYMHGDGDAAKERQYNLGDLKYDTSRKFLQLVPSRPSQSSGRIVVPRTPGTPATPRSTAAPKTPAAGSAPGTPAKRPAPTTPSSPACSTPAKRARAGAAPSTPAKRSASGGGYSRLRCSPQADVLQSCYLPLKERAASGIADEGAIFTIIGLGFSLGLERTLLNTLPDILRMAPEDRGEFAQMTLNQFEKATAKLK